MKRSVSEALAAPVMSALLRFTDPRTEATFQEQRILSATFLRYMAVLYALKAVLTVPHLIMKQLSPQRLLPSWHLALVVATGAVCVVVALLLFFCKRVARKHWTAMKLAFIFIMFSDAVRLGLSQCLRASPFPDHEAYMALVFFYLPLGRAFTFPQVAVMNSICAVFATTIIFFRVHPVSGPISSILLYLANFGISLVMSYFQERLERDAFVLQCHISAQLVEVEARKVSEKQALDARDAQGSFLARMSHEVRTPLNGVSGLIDLLLQCQLPTHELELVTSMRAASDHLMTIVNDILDLGKMAAGKLSLSVADVNVWQIPQQCMLMFAGQMKEKRLRNKVLGWRPYHPYCCTPQASKGVFGDLGWGCLNCIMPKNTVWVPGSRHPTLMVPCMSCTTCLTMDRPRPVPSCSRVMRVSHW